MAENLRKFATVVVLIYVQLEYSQAQTAAYLTSDEVYLEERSQERGVENTKDMEECIAACMKKPGCGGGNRYGDGACVFNENPVIRRHNEKTPNRPPPGTASFILLTEHELSCEGGFLAIVDKRNGKSAAWVDISTLS